MIAGAAEGCLRAAQPARDPFPDARSAAVCHFASVLCVLAAGRRKLSPNAYGNFAAQKRINRVPLLHLHLFQFGARRAKSFRVARAGINSATGTNPIPEPNQTDAHNKKKNRSRRHKQDVRVIRHREGLAENSVIFTCENRRNSHNRQGGDRWSVIGCSFL